VGGGKHGGKRQDRAIGDGSVGKRRENKIFRKEGTVLPLHKMYHKIFFLMMYDKKYFLALDLNSQFEKAQLIYCNAKKLKDVMVLFLGNPSAKKN